MPSSAKHPSRKPMWSGVKFAYLIIAMSLFPTCSRRLLGLWKLDKRRWDVRGIVQLPWTRHIKNYSGFNKPAHRDQQPDLVPDICNASIRQPGV
ncbi:hypothetical protein CK203_005642 [Vitis vinifera]|uniref:Uncharacterized protein n=1 Tax=Vitis vinifera TaxID=29760 RepID=A0A438K485_VITVI|nr:hypothetical protein CK203_005642 [Vitis vinifera]